MKVLNAPVPRSGRHTHCPIKRRVVGTDPKAPHGGRSAGRGPRLIQPHSAAVDDLITRTPESHGLLPPSLIASRINLLSTRARRDERLC